LLRFINPDDYESKTIATVQHALLRGIEIAFQLEEGEILGEPLPSRDDRRAILTYEVTEGGAGVLSQLIQNPNSLKRVARTALSLMHFDQVDEAIAAGDPTLLADQNATCVRGCYRCLLSYYNQPDHEKIDRTNNEAKKMLIDLARGELHLRNSRASSEENVGWLSVFKQLGLPAPDSDMATLGGQDFPFVWRINRAAATIAPLTDTALSYAEEMGWTLFELPEHSTSTLPEGLIQALKS
jgi:hypothetical protein